MKKSLSINEVLAIEKALNKPGASEVTVKVEQGRIVVLAVEKKKIVV